MKISPLVSFVLTFLCPRGGLTLPRDFSCTELDVYQSTNSPSPSSGAQLPYCRTQELQCCTSDYLNSLRSTTSSRLSSSLETDFSNVFNPWRDSYRRLTDSLKEFSNQYIDNHPFPPTVLTYVREFLETQKPILANQLLPTLNMTLSFNFTFFATNLMYELVDRFIAVLPSGITQDQRNCLRPIIRDEIDVSALQNVGNSMKQLQMMSLSLNRTKSFLNQLNLNGIGYSLSDQCLDGFLSQRCQQCQKNVPKLCADVCTSLMVGCLSPIQDGFRSQLETVWNITRQLALSTQSLISKTLRVDQPSALLPSSLVVINDRSKAECGLDLLPILGLGRRRRYVSQISLPPSLDGAVQEVLAINGVFLFNDQSLPSYCGGNNTQESQCWGGQDLNHNGTVTVSSFMTTSITGQIGNPAYTFNLFKLQEQATALTNPIADFLSSSELVDILPSFITIPAIPPYDPPTLPRPTQSTSSTGSTRANQQPVTLYPSQTAEPVEGVTSPTSGTTSQTGSSTYITVVSLLVSMLFSLKFLSIGKSC